MTRPTLPNETLIQIFSHLPSSKSTLYNLSLASGTFSEIAKPFLYRHVTITSKEQRERLKNVKKEDAKLVRKLTIKGKERKLERYADKEPDCRVGKGCIEELFTGKLLDISVIEILHVAFLYDRPESQGGSDRLDFKPASKLVELSIFGHQGGAWSWKTILENASLCPQLCRLGIYEVTEYRRVETGFGLLDVGEPLHLSSEDVRPRLEVCASLPVTGLVKGGGSATFGNLILCPNPTQMVRWIAFTLKAGFNVYLLKHHANFDFMDSVDHEIPTAHDFEEWLNAIRQVVNKRTTFLSLPYLRSDLSDEILDILLEIEEENVEVHYLDEEEEDSISIIPNSFVDFVRRQKKKEEDEEERKKMAS